jgi:hypothetical protein
MMNLNDLRKDTAVIKLFALVNPAKSTTQGNDLSWS